jgi:AbrB family looped-hinge helix DNA binding protein
MRISSRGQVTIPRAIREKAGLLPNTEVEFILERGAVWIVRAGSTRPGRRGEQVLQRLRGSAKGSSLTTEQILAHTRGEP